MMDAETLYDAKGVERMTGVTCGMIAGHLASHPGDIGFFKYGKKYLYTMDSIKKIRSIWPDGPKKHRTKGAHRRKKIKEGEEKTLFDFLPENRVDPKVETPSRQEEWETLG